MKLQSISIENYKSIEYLKFDISEINGSHTYSLLGINESGKSSFLNAISLIKSPISKINYPLDFFDDSKPVSIELEYSLFNGEQKQIEEILTTTHQFDEYLIKQTSINSVAILISFQPSTSKTKTTDVNFNFEKTSFIEYTLSNNKPVKKLKEELDKESFDLEIYFLNNFKEYFKTKIHNIVLWKSAPEYLLLNDIDLNTFSSSPKTTSIPLFNCFILAGIEEKLISKEISKLNSASKINSLQSKLSKLITKHIRGIWPEHKISITFQINNNKISLLIEDDGVEFQPKTTGQRSDGFKQFISFLLTISVENYNEELLNTILLVDEPETHLHPPAQINLLNELIKITSNKNNNLLFFATHSNYLIDKENLDRCYTVIKKDNHTTQLDKITKKKSTYSEVNYEVFGIVTNDYHNELYGYIESENIDLLKELEKTKKWINSKTNKVYDVSLSEYIRHSIHHPENSKNKEFTEKELSSSLKKLRKIKEKLNQ